MQHRRSARQARSFSSSIDRGRCRDRKQEFAKAAAAVDALGPKDEIAIVTFDSEAAPIAKDLELLEAGGGTSFLPALRVAFDVLQTSKLPIKHVIMLSDGESPSDGVSDLVAAMSDARNTITTVGVAGADRDLLTSIADGGQGRLYMVDDLKALPKVFVRELNEAALAIPRRRPAIR
jgi:Ca-activated chloride channel family protein